MELDAAQEDNNLAAAGALDEYAGPIRNLRRNLQDLETDASRA